ncbi:unnamed protein product [Pleuronectes platessa]|uniref:Uncharacterized protein n=1 Tax=Pleuronectes platessa TaxID=8262 RepID=A0A9N7TKK4_PLEPL|nr:unnamed protein product [Pleuronectes platessa]
MSDFPLAQHIGKGLDMWEGVRIEEERLLFRPLRQKKEAKENVRSHPSAVLKEPSLSPLEPEPSAALRTVNGNFPLLVCHVKGKDAVFQRPVCRKPQSLVGCHREPGRKEGMFVEAPLVGFLF